MSYSTFPATSSMIKSVQRGSAASAGNITISAIDTSKSFVTSFSTASAGSVGTNSSTTGTLTPSGGNVSVSSPSFNPAGGSFPNYVGTRTYSGGSTSLISASYGAYIADSTTITTTGACRWEVVEYA
jgi:hypothetical protein